MIRRIQEVEGLYNGCFALAERHGLSERTAGALAEAAYGFRLRNSSYRAVVEATAGEEISDLTASRDLRAIVDAGLFEPIGEKRGRYYLGTNTLTDLLREARRGREPKDLADPFERASRQLQLSLD